MPDETGGPGPGTGTAPRPLPPLPQYTCGACHQTFGSNCDPDDIMCAWCEAQRCPHCHAWFGGEEGVVSPDPGQVSLSREDLQRIVLMALPMTRDDDKFVVRLSVAAEVAW